MYVLLILFFASLGSIAFMLQRKLRLLRAGHVAENTHAHVFVPDLEKIRALAKNNVKHYGYKALVSSLRFYVRSSNELKNQYTILLEKIRNLKNKSTTEAQTIEQEASRFLRMISEYKHKIREIKHRIHEEEKLK